MTKVHPKVIVPQNSCYLSSKQETFTIWMKSLVLSGKGCTVFDSNGKIVYRVDNYNYNGSNKVHLMDIRGKVLFTILKKKFMWFGLWKGYRYSDDREIKSKKPGFQVQKTLWVPRKDSSLCKVIEGLDKNQPSHYKIERCNSKSTCKILNQHGVIVAEVKRKQSACGVLLGEDVLTMVVEPSIDHSMIMGLVVTCSLINSKM